MDKVQWKRATPHSVTAYVLSCERACRRPCVTCGMLIMPSSTQARVVGEVRHPLCASPPARLPSATGLSRFRPSRAGAARRCSGAGAFAKSKLASAASSAHRHPRWRRCIRSRKFFLKIANNKQLTTFTCVEEHLEDPDSINRVSACLQRSTAMLKRWRGADDARLAPRGRPSLASQSQRSRSTLRSGGALAPGRSSLAATRRSQPSSRGRSHDTT
eukprot:6194089-Pleurochrysis_carterae.AAC.2